MVARLVQAVLDDLSKDLLCVNTELRHIYDVWSKHKAGLVWGEADVPHSMALTGAQMWQMLRVCQIPDANCPLALLNPCLVEVRQRHAAFLTADGACLLPASADSLPLPTSQAAIFALATPACQDGLSAAQAHLCSSIAVTLSRALLRPL